MTVTEANAIVDSITDREKSEWEKTRWLGYVTCLSNGAKLKTPQDLIKFSWEEVTLPVDTRTKEEVWNSLVEIKNSPK